MGKGKIDFLGSFVMALLFILFICYWLYSTVHRDGSHKVIFFFKKVICLFVYFYFMCFGVLFSSLGTEVTDNCELPLEEQPVLITIKPSLQASPPQAFSFIGHLSLLCSPP